MTDAVESALSGAVVSVGVRRKGLPRETMAPSNSRLSVAFLLKSLAMRRRRWVRGCQLSVKSSSVTGVEALDQVSQDAVKLLSGTSGRGTSGSTRAQWVPGQAPVVPSGNLGLGCFCPGVGEPSLHVVGLTLGVGVGGT